MSPSPSRRSTHTHVHRTSRRRFLWERIEPAIRGKSCPICLGHIDDRRAAVITSCLHAYCIDCVRRWSDLKRKCPLCNAEFDSWFFKINLSSRTFFKQQLLPPAEDRKVIVGALGSRRRDPSAEQRVFRRYREEFNCANLRTRPLPRQRWFGRSGLESSDVVARRVIQWRVSIYNRHLQAIPCSSRSCLLQNAAGNNGVKETILKRIEPWIRRELQAILGDPDPSVIVHVASSLFISSLNEKRKVPTERSVVRDSYLEPLRPFLYESTNMFWHELRSFAESPFNMETYDSVVEYTKL